MAVSRGEVASAGAWCYTPKSAHCSVSAFHLFFCQGYIAFSQFLCGGAKDLTKLGGKTVSKLVQPDEKQSRLFKTVAFVTGLKNSCKGIGYFIGAASLYVSFQFALGVALALILVALPIVRAFPGDGFHARFLTAHPSSSRHHIGFLWPRGGGRQDRAVQGRDAAHAAVTRTQHPQAVAGEGLFVRVAGLVV